MGPPKGGAGPRGITAGLSAGNRGPAAAGNSTSFDAAQVKDLSQQLSQFHQQFQQVEQNQKILTDVSNKFAILDERLQSGALNNPSL